MAEKNFCSSLPLVNVCYILFLFISHCHFHKWLGIYTHHFAKHYLMFGLRLVYMYSLLASFVILIQYIFNNNIFLKLCLKIITFFKSYVLK